MKQFMNTFYEQKNKKYEKMLLKCVPKLKNKNNKGFGARHGRGHRKVGPEV